MIKYVIRRVLLMIPIILGITLIVAAFIEIAPGDPARIKLGSEATEEELQQFRDSRGIDDPFFVKYVRFIGNAVRGDFGKSFYNERDVASELFQRFSYTLIIAISSVALAIVVGIPLGIFAATHQYKIWDNIAVGLSLIFVSMPSFFFALLLIRFFSLRLGILPTAGVASWKGWILPTVSLALGFAATITRQMRSNMLETIKQDYITTVRAKGQSEFKIRYIHALKNAIIPIIMVVGGLFGMALGGAMIAEIIYSVPGLGQFTLSGLTGRDYPVVQGSTLFMSVIFSIMMLLIDIGFAFVDPRIRSQFTKRGKKELVSMKQ